MKSIKNYNIYIFISTLTRNIIDVYSVIYLYKLGFSVNEIIMIYALTYFFGYFISSLSLKLGKKIGYKYILIISSIITSVTFYIIKCKCNLYLISLSLSLSMFTYHPIKHYYGIYLLKQKKEIGNTLIFTYLATLLSSYVATVNINKVYLVIISIVGIIPALFIKKEDTKDIEYPRRIDRNRLKFFFFDQFKIVFILLEPLYLYLISDNISYVGIFNIVLIVSSIVWVYLLANKINVYKNYKYINLIFVLVLILKLNIHNKLLLLIVAFIEGIGVKTNELVSTMNLYNNRLKSIGYIIISEKIFCMTRALILSIIYFLPFNLKIILYFLLIGIFLLGFQYKKDTL